MNEPDLEAQLIAAIQAQSLPAFVERCTSGGTGELDDRDRALLDAASSACEGIAARCATARDALLGEFRRHGIACPPDDDGDDAPSQQLHRFRIRLAERDPTAAVEVALRLGYRAPLTTGDAGWELYRRFNDRLVLARFDDRGSRVDLEWTLGAVGRRWPWRVRPRLSDTRDIGASAGWWPLFTVVVAARRLVGMDRQRADDGPVWGWMGTPPSLMDALFRFADVGDDDVLLDLGSGDGRVVIEAARRFGITAIGVERDEALCRNAVDAAKAAGVADLVDIRCAEAATAPIESASVIFLFLPIEAVSELVPGLLTRMPAGGRIVAHEQAPVDFQRQPDISRPVFSDDAISVAHLWRAGDAPA